MLLIWDYVNKCIKLQLFPNFKGVEGPFIVDQIRKYFTTIHYRYISNFWKVQKRIAKESRFSKRPTIKLFWGEQLTDKSHVMKCCDL